MTYGQGALEDWRDTLLEAFGNTLTIDQWTTQVKGKVRQEGETVRAYWYSKVRICALPGRFAITAGDSLPDAGYANVQAESLILAARPCTLDDFYITLENGRNLCGSGG